MTYKHGVWTCKPCKVELPLAQMDRIRAHLGTKKHKRLQYACPRCSSTRMQKIPGECWDRDGIRQAKKCERCKTEYKAFASGISEKAPDEYTGALPKHVLAAVEAAERATYERLKAKYEAYDRAD